MNKTPPYAKELCELLNGEVIYVSDSKGNEYAASLSINNPSAIAKLNVNCMRHFKIKETT
jgi:hypothetical protein